MPALEKPKHEIIAQALAKGKTQVEACAEAGYALHDGNAARLIGNDRIQDRVAELQQMNAVRTGETVERITADLREAAAKAADMVDQHGPAAVQALRAALMDIAKLNGLIIEKRENTNTVIRAEDVSDDELAAIIARGRGRVRRRDPGETPLN